MWIITPSGTKSNILPIAIAGGIATMGLVAVLYLVSKRG